MVAYTLPRNGWLKLAKELDRIATEHEFGPAFSGRLMGVRTAIMDALASAGDRVEVRLKADVWEGLESMLSVMGGEIGQKACAFLVAHRVAAEM